ncbi:hypothetical protein [Methylobacterium sp. SyP6R]|uniref:hypothetical protein n=1 Tax=Methylobacterium sp. SyP6R TaxID=2718876 RepID=UPI001F39A834|nr:hypothetical protein [Methylobacterium sp. SyP6R]MCF4130312.1 hypothetical protein [Methylobacterium sp. SyP6R]
MMRYFAGLDISLNDTALCVVNEVGTIIREGKAGSEPAALIVWLADLGCPWTGSVMEAGLLSPWLYEGPREAAYPATCIETRRSRQTVQNSQFCT